MTLAVVGVVVVYYSNDEANSAVDEDKKYDWQEVILVGGFLVAVRGILGIYGYTSDSPQKRQ